MTLVYGLDFGTTNSAIMVGDTDGKVIRVRNPMTASYEVPSAVCLRKDRKLVVGTIATNMKRQRAAWFRDEFKRDIGDPRRVNFPAEEPGGRAADYEVHELVAEVLSALRERAEHEVPGTPDLVVITVPASWQAANRDHMLLAADQAGFDLGRVRLVTEPEAAVAFAVQEHLGLDERTLLLYDLGGGTFDCALVRGRGRLGFQMLGDARGLDDIGGATFNRRILGLIRQRYPDETKALMDGPHGQSQILARRLLLMDTCESAKQTLSTEDRYEGDLNELGLDADFVLTRTDLTELLSPLLKETIDECERLLHGQGLTWADIDGVVPVGGSSRLPMVGEAIARRAGRGRTSVLRVGEPELAVVHGAVLHALSLVGGASDPPRPAPRERRRGEAVPLPTEPYDPYAPGNEDSWAVSEEPGWPGQWAAEPTPEPEPEPAVPEQESATFFARHTSNFTAALRTSRNAFVLALLTGGLALFNFFGLFHGGGTQNYLDDIAYALTGMTVVFYLIVRYFMRRGLQDSSGVTVAAVCMSMAAAAHQIPGWFGWTLVTLLLIATALGLLAVWGTDLAKGNFLIEVTVDRNEMSFVRDDRTRVCLSWEQIESLTITPAPHLLIGKLHGIAPLPFNQWARSGGYKLFGQYHFDRQDELLQAIDTYSGGRFGLGAWAPTPTPPR